MTDDPDIGPATPDAPQPERPDPKPEKPAPKPRKPRATPAVRKPASGARLGPAAPKTAATPKRRAAGVVPEPARRSLRLALVTALLERAGAAQVTVSTGIGNAPARELYLTRGFRSAGDIEVVPRLWVSQYVRPAANPTAG